MERAELTEHNLSKYGTSLVPFKSNILVNKKHFEIPGSHLEYKYSLIQNSIIIPEREPKRQLMLNLK